MADFQYRTQGRDGSVEVLEPVVGDVPFLPGKLPPTLDACEGYASDVLYDSATLKVLQKMGYDRLGSAVFAYDVYEADVVNILGLHTPSAKNPEAVWSVPSETSQYYRDESGAIIIESAVQTATRCLVEELGIKIAQVLLPKQTPWVQTEWPIGSIAEDKRKIFAPFVAIGLPFFATQEPLSIESDELDEARFFNIQKLFELASSDRRAGATEAVIQAIMLQPFLGMRSGKPGFLSNANLTIESPSDIGRYFTSTTIQELMKPYNWAVALGYEWRDVKFSEMEL